ncbi:MAG: GNAT family N-acetyltransferase [Candidatus Cloacimonadales bacterium]|nr:GNAT family N-acetyltransferase [Candidatus Cloacimonadales bacterium]
MKIDYTTSLPEKIAYFELFNSTGWNADYHLTADELFQSIQNSSYCISAYDDENLVGFGRMLSDGIAHAVLFDVIILPDYREKGIGRKITEMLIEECKKLKVRDIQLFCAKGKLGFYEKLGFQPRPGDAPGMEIRLRY